MQKAGISSSTNSLYPVSSLGADLGVTQVTYSFEIDFGRGVSTSTNTAATWNYFYDDLIGEGLMASEIGSVYPEINQGYDADYFSRSDMGQISGGRNGVRIFTNASLTSRWKVEDWKVGDQFQLVDLATPPAGGGAVYYYGNVSLVSIQPIPEPSAYVLTVIGGCALLMRRMRIGLPLTAGSGASAGLRRRR